MADKPEQPVTGEVVPWESDRPLPAMIEPTPELWQAFRQAVIKGDASLMPEVGDPSLTSERILEQMSEGTLEQALAPQATLPSWRRDYLDVPVVVCAFHVNPSSFENEDTGRSGLYAVVELMTGPSGELVTVQTGGEKVLMTLGLAWKDGAFPFKARLIEKATSTKGRAVLELEAV